jgi:hypothetical protein
MNTYFKDVNALAEWLSDSGYRKRAYVRPNQERRAKTVLAEGGLLLSYIMGIRCWAGVSRITGTQLRKSGDWDKAFPKYFDVEPTHVLETPEKCFLVRESKLRTGHDGRGAYNHIWKNGEHIHEQIKEVAAMSARDAKVKATADVAFEDFKRSWNEARDRCPSYVRLRIKESRGQCSMCGVTKQEWIDRILKKSSPWRTALDMNRIRHNDFRLLDVHHCEPVKDGGTAKLGNLIPVCPNCHALLTRAGKRGRVR